VGVNTSTPVGVSQTLTGTTIADYASALVWPCVGLGKKQIQLKNTHVTNGLKYKVLTYLDPDGMSSEFVAETTLAASGVDTFVLERAYAKIVVQVKTAVGTSHATYQLDFAGGRA